MEADNIALFVWLSPKNLRGVFSDNGFLMVTPKKTLEFNCSDPDVTAEQLKDDLTVTHLVDKQYDE